MIYVILFEANAYVVMPLVLHARVYEKIAKGLTFSKVVKMRYNGLLGGKYYPPGSKAN